MDNLKRIFVYAKSLNCNENNREQALVMEIGLEKRETHNENEI